MVKSAHIYITQPAKRKKWRGIETAENWY